MSKEKQIEEMAITMVDSNNKEVKDALSLFFATLAEALYKAGYRKQKHGTWYHGTENGVVYARCSACGRKMNYSCYGYAYCSLCGARMDGAGSKEDAERWVRNEGKL